MANSQKQNAKSEEKLAAPATNRRRRLPLFLQVAVNLSNKECNHDGDERCTLYEGCGQNHVCTNVTNCLRLTSNGFHCFATDLADADTSTDYCETHSDCGD